MKDTPGTPKRLSRPPMVNSMASLIAGLARVEEQMKAHVSLLERIELQYNERMANEEKRLQATCVTADTALFEARNNTDRIDIMKWVIGGVTIFLTTALAIILQVILTR
jgi:hypothetical protein